MSETRIPPNNTSTVAIVYVLLAPPLPLAISVHEYTRVYICVKASIGHLWITPLNGIIAIYMRSKFSKETQEEIAALKNVKRPRGRPKLTPKQREFARKYVELGTATDAYRAAYDAENMAQPSVHTEAARTLKIPSVSTEIERLFAAHGMEMSDVLSIHARNMRQEEHLPTSQRAVGDYYELTGMKKSAATPTVNVAFVINRGETHTTESKGEQI